MVGNRLTSQELDGSLVAYQYDASDQLTRETRTGTAPYDTQYQYDPVGHRLTKNEGGAPRTTLPR